MQWCQFCDKEMRLDASVVYIHDYVTCGAGKCKQKAQKAYDALVTEAVMEQRVRETEKHRITELFTVFSTRTPALIESWKPVDKKFHPEFLKDPDVVAKMLDDGVQAQDPDNPDVWYAIIRTGDIVEALSRKNEKTVTH